MADKPITFSAPMVRALLAGTKTQTRRLLSPTPEWEPEKFDGFTFAAGWSWKNLSRFHEENFGETAARYTPIQPGDRVYVREAYYQFGHWEPVEGKQTKGGKQKWAFVPDHPKITFDAPEEHRLGRHHKDPFTPAWHKRLGRFMPRGNSRMWLEITDVRVQRLQDISNVDARREGVDRWKSHCGTKWYRDYSDFEDAFEEDYSNSARLSFETLWNSLHTEPGTTWADNPWIVAYTFTVHQGNIDG